MVAALILGYAESSASSMDLLVLILEAMAVIAGAAIAGVIPLFITTARRTVRPHALPPACLLWAIVAVGGLLWQLFARYHWNGEYQKLVMSGYYDAAQKGDEPALHWLFWVILVLGYAGLLVRAAVARPLPRREQALAAPEPAPSPEPPRQGLNGHPKSN